MRTRALISFWVADKSTFLRDCFMVMIDPKKAKPNLPDAYLLAIGKVCVQWGILETFVEMTIIKLAGMSAEDPRSKITFNHMTWPQRMDVLNSLIDYLTSGYPRLKDFETDVKPLLKKAQEGRNRVVHGFWGFENGKVTLLRATARGKLKLHMDEMTVSEIDSVLGDIHNAAAALWNKVIGT